MDIVIVAPNADAKWEPLVQQLVDALNGTVAKLQKHWPNANVRVCPPGDHKLRSRRLFCRLSSDSLPGDSAEAKAELGRFSIETDPKLSDASPTGKLRAEAAPPGVVLCEESSEAILTLVQKLLEGQQSQAFRFMALKTAMQVGSFLVACVVVIATVAAIWGDKIVAWFDPPPPAVVALELKRDHPTFSGPRPLEANGEPLRVGDELRLVIGGNNQAAHTVLVAFEGRGWFVDEASELGWRLEYPGMATMLTLSVNSHRWPGAGYESQLQKVLEARFRDLGPVAIPEGLHYVWSGQSFSPKRGFVDKGPTGEQAHDNFSTWAGRLIALLNERLGDDWTVSGRSFDVRPADESAPAGGPQ